MIGYHLIQIGDGGFSFQIEDQGDQVTNYVLSRQNKTFYANNGWRVMIHKHPEVDVENKIVYLRGSKKTKDERIHSVYNLPGKECKKTISAVHQALRDVVESAKFWKNRRAPRYFETIVINPCVYDPFAALRSLPNVVVICND